MHNHIISIMQYRAWEMILNVFFVSKGHFLLVHYKIYESERLTMKCLILALHKENHFPVENSQ